jgi:hypothetical protein
MCDEAKYNSNINDQMFTDLRQEKLEGYWHDFKTMTARCELCDVPLTPTEYTYCEYCSRED